ncbi:MAG: GNAT family N-acetyltransferase, partial [Candidatus Zixiibacteriota bacterium]
MAVPEYTVITGTDHPDFAAATVKLTGAAWPEFMLHDPLAEYFNSLYRHLPQFQFALVQKGSDTWMAMGNSIPLAWDGRPADLPDTGWDWAMEKGIKDFETARRPTVLCALQVVVASDFKGKGVSFQAVRTMTSIGKAHGLGAMIAPVRPSMKSRYPLTPMERFISWKNDDGLPFDSWMRVHARLGAD